MSTVGRKTGEVLPRVDREESRRSGHPEFIARRVELIFLQSWGTPVRRPCTGMLLARMRLESAPQCTKIVVPMSREEITPRFRKQGLVTLVQRLYAEHITSALAEEW